MLPSHGQKTYLEQPEVPPDGLVPEKRGQTKGKWPPNGLHWAKIRKLGLKTGGTDCLQYRIWASPIKQNTNGVRTDCLFQTFLKKSAPHRAISTEQYPRRNNQTEGSANYSPPVLPFFPADHSRILLRELERQVARSGERSRAC